MEAKPESLVPTIPHQTNEFVNEVVWDGTKQDRDLPRAPLKGLQITVYGSFDVAYGANTPVETGKGIAHDLLKEIEIEDGLGDIRNIRFQDMRRLAKIIQGSDSPALYQHNSAVLSNPTTGFFTFTGLADGQTTCFRETVRVPFECWLAEADFLETLLTYNGVKDNVIRLDVAKTMAEIQKPSNQASDPITYSNVSIKIKVEAIQTEFAGGGKRWSQRPEERNYSAATTKDIIRLDDVRNLLALNIECTYGADKTAVSIEEAEQIKFDLVGKKAGRMIQIKNEVSLADLMFNDLSNKKQQSIIAGFARMNMISGNQLHSALANVYDDLHLRVSMGSGLANFGDTYNVRVLIDEVA